VGMKGGGAPAMVCYRREEEKRGVEGILRERQKAGHGAWWNGKHIEVLRRSGQAGSAVSKAAAEARAVFGLADTA
jgi:hypothetical protein